IDEPKDLAKICSLSKGLQAAEVLGLRTPERRGTLVARKRNVSLRENDLKALQSVGQIVGEVLKQLTKEKFIRQLDKRSKGHGRKLAFKN
uniref:Uncharacterized protein n=1 Tax=Monodelphis domestica TaxID=13616 RepID=A0A5F8GQT8_MONDO